MKQKRASHILRGQPGWISTRAPCTPGVSRLSCPQAHPSEQPPPPCTSWPRSRRQDLSAGGMNSAEPTFHRPGIPEAHSCVSWNVGLPRATTPRGHSSPLRPSPSLIPWLQRAPARPLATGRSGEGQQGWDLGAYASRLGNQAGKSRGGERSRRRVSPDGGGAGADPGPTPPAPGPGSQ